MYIPTAFELSDLGELHAAMERYSFATLVTSTAADPEISHLPLLLDRSRGPYGILIGHFARANRHWESEPNGRTTAIFHGPHAYISPTWYAEPNLVPTWNYVTVHAHGVLTIREDRDWLQACLHQLVQRYESGQPNPWRMESLEPAVIDKLLRAIVGFELPIERLEGKWKLNQNHPPERRRRVIENLRASHAPENAALSHWMQLTLDAR